MIVTVGLAALFLMYNIMTLQWMPLIMVLYAVMGTWLDGSVVLNCPTNTFVQLQLENNV